MYAHVTFWKTCKKKKKKISIGISHKQLTPKKVTLFQLGWGNPPCYLLIPKTLTVSQSGNYSQLNVMYC